MTPIDKSSVYGPVHASHANIGLAWQALIQQHYSITLPGPMPPWLVELMLVAFKTHRSARVYHPDNYGDLMTYAGFAEHAQANPGQEYVFPAGSKACEPGYEAPCGGQVGSRFEVFGREDGERIATDLNGFLARVKDEQASAHAQMDEFRKDFASDPAKFAATDGMSGEFK